MNFLDEATIHTSADKLAKVKAAADPDDEIHVMDEKKGKDLDGDGDIDSDDYLAARDAAIKKAKSMKEETLEEGKIKDLLVALGIATAGIAGLKALDARDPVIKAINTAQEQGKIDTPEEKKVAKLMLLQRGVWLDTGKGEGGDLTVAKVNKALNEGKKTVELPADTTFTLDLKHLMKKHMDEGKSKENTIKFTKALMAKLHNKGEVTVDGTKIIFKEIQRLPNSNSNPILTGDPEKAKKPGYKLVTQQDIANNKDLFNDILNQLDGADLSNEGKKKSGYMGYTEMAEADIPQDTQLTLPEPDAPDYLGDDGMDYEGGMAKSQMLKMKNYAKALCDMIEDESQLESWVQAKLTKASDYMSSVYHYLDYQRSKMNEEEEFKPLTKQEKDSLVKNGKLKKSELAAYEKFLKDNPDLPDSMPKAIKAFKAKK